MEGMLLSHLKNDSFIPEAIGEFKNKGFVIVDGFINRKMKALLIKL